MIPGLAHPRGAPALDNDFCKKISDHRSRSTSHEAINKSRLFCFIIIALKIIDRSLAATGQFY
jgi:hypothetical protein